MKILHLSDTHGHHRELKELPATDVLIHSGDMCFAGTADD
jgi:predicted phosphodiesterase